MNLNLSRISPSVTNMIRMDHTHVLMIFRRFQPDTSHARKEALVKNACLALEIHAQLEEEIFYPALRSAIDGNIMLDKSVPEHDEMRSLIGRLRAMRPGDTQYEQTVHELMRTVLHHVADEESILLPLAEERLRGELGSLGAQMTQRRMQLMKGHVGEVAAATAKSFPGAAITLGLGGLALGLMLLGNRRSAARQYPYPYTRKARGLTHTAHVH